MTSISAKPASESVSSPETAVTPKGIDRADAATMLLPGLQHAHSLLTVAINVLRHFAPPPPHNAAVSNAEAAVKIRRVLAEFGHPAARR